MSLALFFAENPALFMLAFLITSVIVAMKA